MAGRSRLSVQNCILHHIGKRYDQNRVRVALQVGVILEAGQRRSPSLFDTHWFALVRSSSRRQAPNLSSNCLLEISPSLTSTTFATSDLTLKLLSAEA